MIRFAKETDIPKIMKFINTYWEKGHILGNDENFFRYEHLLDEGVTYVINENTNSEINAILGYIPYGKKNRDIMTVMWKANHTSEPSLGLELFNFLQNNADIRIMASPGSNKKLAGLYHYLGYQFGKMIQWYRLNPKQEYRIAKIKNAYIPQISNNNKAYIKLNTYKEFEEYFDFDSYQNSLPKPFKEAWYIKKRYYNHPIYKYEIYGLQNNTKKVDTIFIFRKICVDGHNVLRLIDCIGKFKDISFATAMIDKLLQEYDAEYVDCYECGLPEQMFIEAGWLKTEDSENIIPNYFKPFVQENIDIYYFSTDKEIVLFKGDGDQDRPN